MVNLGRTPLLGASLRRQRGHDLGLRRSSRRDHSLQTRLVPRLQLADRALHRLEKGQQALSAKRFHAHGPRAQPTRPTLQHGQTAAAASRFRKRAADRSITAPSRLHPHTPSRTRRVFPKNPLLGPLEVSALRLRHRNDQSDTRARASIKTTRTRKGLDSRRLGSITAPPVTPRRSASPPRMTAYLRRRGSILTGLASARLFLRAIRARALVAAAAGACLPDHGEMILTDSSQGPSAAVPEARLRQARTGGDGAVP